MIWLVIAACVLFLLATVALVRRATPEWAENLALCIEDAAIEEMRTRSAVDRVSAMMGRVNRDGVVHRAPIPGWMPIRWSTWGGQVTLTEAAKLKIGDPVRALWNLRSRIGAIPFKTIGRIDSKSQTNARNGDPAKVEVGVYFGSLHGVVICDPVQSLEVA